MNERSCLTCKHWLGGVYSCCRINLEAECAKGEHEAWEAGPLGMATRQEEAPRRDAMNGVRGSAPTPTAADVISHLQIIRTWAAWGDQHGTGIAEAACAPIVDWIDDALALLKGVDPDA